MHVFSEKEALLTAQIAQLQSKFERLHNEK